MGNVREKNKTFTALFPWKNDEVKRGVEILSAFFSFLSWEKRGKIFVYFSLLFLGNKQRKVFKSSNGNN